MLKTTETNLLSSTPQKSRNPRHCEGGYSSLPWMQVKPPVLYHFFNWTLKSLSEMSSYWFRFRSELLAVKKTICQFCRLLVEELIVLWLWLLPCWRSPPLCVPPEFLTYVYSCLFLSNYTEFIVQEYRFFCSHLLWQILGGAWLVFRMEYGKQPAWLTGMEMES